MLFLLQVHAGFNQPEILSLELQAQDQTATQLQQEVREVMLKDKSVIDNNTSNVQTFWTVYPKPEILFLIESYNQKLKLSDTDVP